MPIGYVTENQGESRYTVAIPRKTPLLTALIEARRVEIEGIDAALEELRKQEQEQRAVYDAAMATLGESMAGYTECRESYTTLQCRNAKISAANDVHDEAMAACFDEWQDCRFSCDIGDGECQDACDDAREACEQAADRALDNALAAVDRLCQDAIVAHLQACQAQWTPVITEAQTAATAALAPLQDTMIAITWEKTKRTAAVRRLNELEGIEARSDVRTAWSAQYNDELPTGENPAEPTGSEENAVTVATVSGRAVITEISSIAPCAHDARALPAGILFLDSALATGSETWRPTWRTGRIDAVNSNGTLKVRVDPAILPGTLGTLVSKRDINCTPPGVFFDADGELDARLGIARQEYADALEARDVVLDEITTCQSTYTVEICTAPRNDLCTETRDEQLLACIDARDACLAAAEDANGVQYCMDQYALCVDQVELIYSACIDGAMADCIAAKTQHDAQCVQLSQGALTEAETAVDTALRELRNASADIQGPPSTVLIDASVAHCVASRYVVGDDVLLDFPARAVSTGLDWSTATSEQIRTASMGVWRSARVVGWASNTRECEVCGDSEEDEFVPQTILFHRAKPEFDPEEYPNVPDSAQAWMTPAGVMTIGGRGEFTPDGEGGGSYEYEDDPTHVLVQWRDRFFVGWVAAHWEGLEMPWMDECAPETPPEPGDACYPFPMIVPVVTNTAGSVTINVHVCECRPFGDEEVGEPLLTESFALADNNNDPIEIADFTLYDMTPDGQRFIIGVAGANAFVIVDVPGGTIDVIPHGEVHTLYDYSGEINVGEFPYIQLGGSGYSPVAAPSGVQMIGVDELSPNGELILSPEITAHRHVKMERIIYVYFDGGEVKRVTHSAEATVDYAYRYSHTASGTIEASNSPECYQSPEGFTGSIEEELIARESSRMTWAIEFKRDETSAWALTGESLGEWINTDTATYNEWASPGCDNGGPVVLGDDPLGEAKNLHSVATSFHAALPIEGAPSDPMEFELEYDADGFAVTDGNHLTTFSKVRYNDELPPRPSSLDPISIEFFDISGREFPGMLLDILPGEGITGALFRRAVGGMHFEVQDFQLIGGVCVK